MTAKIFRNAFLIGFTVLLACILLFFFIMYSNYQAQAFDNLAIEAEHISEGMQICGGKSYLSAVQSGERITWIAADGSVLYDNMADSSTMENHLQRPEVAEAFETGSGRSDRYSSTILEKNNYYALLLKDGTVLRVAGKQTSLAAMALMLVQPSLWIVVLVLVLCGLLAMRLARQIVRPINAINPDNPNATPTYQELQPLITRLQEQNRTIRTQLSELSTRQREFDAITENMREGFLIVDNKCSILSSNRSALRLLGIDDAQKPENLHQAVCSGKLRAQGLRRGRAGALRIDENDEGLARLLHVGDGAGLGLAVVLARDIGDGPVCRDDDAEGAVVLHDLFGAELRRLRHGQLLRGPGRGDHAGLAVLGVADRAGDHVAHGVDQAHAQRRLAVGADARGLVRNEFRLRGHDGPAGAGLRQLVGGAFALIDVFDVRQHELLHEALDECGFSRPHRADDADIDRAVHAPGDLLIDRSVFHSPPPLPYMGMRRSLPASTSGCVR